MTQNDEMYATMKSLNFMKDNVLVEVFDDKTAVAVFSGKAESESKDGTKMKLNDFHASILFRKIDGNWKVAFTHESADQEIIPPIVDSTIKE